MIILLEGPPRAGKSYHAVKDHILPALKAGRHVYARINGLDVEKIAAYLELPESRIRELLTVVALDEVKPLFTCFGDDPPRFEVEADSLVIIDEVQDTYPSARQPLPPEQEAFFAKHGHIGLDIVIMTQAVGRMHSAIRQRVERKSVITKLTALGKPDGYSVRFFSVADTMGKFEKISHERGEYDPAIYPLYDGYQPQVKNTGAYTAGSKTVWQVIKGPAIAVGVALVIGIGVVVYFFKGGGLVPDQEPVASVSTARVAPPIVANPMPQVSAAPEVKHSPEVALVLQYSSTGRPRYAGSINDLHVVEWRAPGGQVLDRFTSEQMIALGWTIQRTEFGIIARADGEMLIFTAWPLDEIFSQSEQTAQRIRNAGEPRPATQEPADVTSGTVAHTGGIITAVPIHATDVIASRY